MVPLSANHDGRDARSKRRIYCLSVVYQAQLLGIESLIGDVHTNIVMHVNNACRQLRSAQGGKIIGAWKIALATEPKCLHFQYFSTCLAQ
jgi:phosphodiesterase/alkaline phosphatase D-like protein